MGNLQSPKEALLAALARSEVDPDQVLELATQLAQTSDRVRFSVDAGIINRLGRELVTRKEIAVAELIKNAYDADATQVTLTFQDTETPGGTLIIEDNGQGMNRERLLLGFMRLAATEKIHEPYSPQYNRLRAGRKGIGRFATQRLGHILTVYTQCAGESALKLRIDWTRFEADKELFLISQEILVTSPRPYPGTTLTIEGLEEAWSTTEIKSAYRHIGNLLQPFPLSKSRIEHEDPGFDVKLFEQRGEHKEEVASAETSIYEYALAKISGDVDVQGYGKISYVSENYGLNVEDVPFGTKDAREKIVPYESLRDIHFVAYYYIYTEIATSQKKLLQGILTKKGGIRVYRNGFRVLPYGEPNNDWLFLEQRSARRLTLIPIRNQHFLGFVEITDIKGNLFEETASREGLLENQAFNELRHFVGGALETAAIDIGKERGRKTKPTSSNQPTSSPIERIATVVEELNQSLATFTTVLESQGETAPEDFAKAVTEVKETAQELISEYREAQRATLHEIEMLRILASLGLAIGEFTHEIKTLFPGVKADADNIMALESLEKIHTTAARMKQNMETLSAYLSFFDRSIAANIHREARPLEISEALSSFWKIIEPSAQRRGIAVYEPEINGFMLLTTSMHPSEWSSILFNLYTNACKAIRRKNVRPGKILIRAGQQANRIFVEFADNGDGIPTENRQRIFEAFFTTAPLPDPLADPMEGLQGSGLGLKIIKDIVETRKGNIGLVDAPPGYTTCFRIEIPAATGKERKDHGY